MTVETSQDIRLGATGLRAPQALSIAGWRLSVGWAVVPLFLLDAICIIFSMAVAYQIRFRLLEYHAPHSGAFYLRLAFVAIPMWVAVFAAYSLYHPDSLFGGQREYANVFNACTVGPIGLALLSFLVRGSSEDISRGWLAALWFVSVITVSLTRFGYRRLIYRLRERGLFVRRVIVVGANEEGRAVARQLRAVPKAGLEVLGFVDPRLPWGKYVDEQPVLGSPDALGSLVRLLDVQELIVIPTALTHRELLGVYQDLGTADEVRISLSSGLYEILTTGVRVSEPGFVPLVSLNRTRITGMDAVMKLGLDYVGALTGVILLTPVFAVITFLIWLDSRGPIIHRRRVVGLHGREFDAYKFRTMVPDADAFLGEHPELREQWEQIGKIRDDPRITKIGRFLRRFSLDELPQLFNVLRGEMSLVGPRIITQDEVRHFGRWYQNLMTVRPGLTGLWQVSGRSDLPYEERVRLDTHYIRNYTIWEDLKLLLATGRVVLRGRGAD